MIFFLTIFRRILEFENRIILKNRISKLLIIKDNSLVNIKF